VVVSERAATRVRELLNQCDGRTTRERFHVSIYKRACAILREREGVDFEELYDGLDQVCVGGSASFEGSTVLAIIAATFEALRRTPIAPVSPGEFELRINQILEAEGIPYRLQDGAWRSLASTEAEVLRRILLRGDDEAAGCRQGDQQVEMVVSTIQARLASSGAVLVDYGAGLGRVLAGLAQAERFRSARYVAVDEPVPDSVRTLAGTTGASASFLGRIEYLAAPIAADVIMVVNTLHHIPFQELAAQLTVLFTALKPGGSVLVHEMGTLREPEQRNVPWRIEDLYALFHGPAFRLNPRSTVSRTGVPLAHVLVQRGDDADLGEALKANIQTAWWRMKERTLQEVAELYESRDESRHGELQHALIVNANLDLNSPAPE
jgi:hypothetical protein